MVLDIRHAAERVVREVAASALGGYRPYATKAGRRPQEEFHRAAVTHRVRVLRGGNRSGKTCAAAVDLVHHLTRTSPYLRLPAGPRKAWAVALDWRHGVGEVLWPGIKRWLPPSRIRAIEWHRKEAPELPSSLVLDDGSLLTFKSADSGPLKFQGAELDYALVDEEVDGEIISETRARLIDRNGHLVVAATPLRGQRWLRELEAEPGTHLTRLRMSENPFLLESVVAAALGRMSARERALRDAGDYVEVEGLIYPEFHEPLHVVRRRGREVRDAAGRLVAPWPLPRSWPRVMGIDFGFQNPFSALWLAAEPTDGETTWWVYRCAHRAGVRATLWGEAITDIERRAREVGERAPLSRWADHDAGDRADLAASGIVTRPANKDVALGLLAVARWFVPREDGSPRIRIVVDEEPVRQHEVAGRLDAQAVVDELHVYRAKKGEGPVKEHDHAMDALRYAAMGVSGAWRREPVSLESLPRTEAPAPVEMLAAPGADPFEDAIPRGGLG